VGGDPGPPCVDVVAVVVMDDRGASVRISWLAQLFTRSKPTPVPIEPKGPPRFRGEPAAAARVVAQGPPRPRIAPAPTPLPAASRHAEPRDELVRTTKMPPQEELSIQVSEGLKGLTKVLGSIDEKLVVQQRATELVAERLQTLPRVLEGLVSAEKVSLETLRDLRTSLEKQGEASQKATAELEKIPTIVDTISTRIHEQTTHASAVRTSVESVGGSVRALVEASQRTQIGLIAEFRRGQEEQRQRLQALVDRQRLAIWVLGGLAVAVVVCLTVVLVRLTG
jgi:hypothetical protein